MFFAVVLASGFIRVPPLGFNTWNKFGCSGISGAVLTGTADAFVELGLKDAGYEYINSDDCWMDQNRSDGGAGPQVPQAAKFPQGMRAVADYIHAKGLKLGLYTARAPHTCAGFAASCGREAVDVRQWANWTVDYMKDDSCGDCGRPVEVDYGVMQAAIRDGGRPMVLTIEGQPDIADVHTGCCGSARRVGHDIGPRWNSMTSLVDKGSGLWPYAHNGSLTTVEGGGGFFNDLDMLELGNGAFNASVSALYAAQARSHFSLWAAMKAVMLLGCDLEQVREPTLEIVKNAEALAISQDPWVAQARRIAVAEPKNDTLSAPDHAIVLLKPCQATADEHAAPEPLQQWHLASRPGGPGFAHLWIAPCNASDPAQRFDGGGSSSASSALQPEMPGGTCVEGVDDPAFFAKLVPCNASDPLQRTARNATTGHVHVGSSSSHCLDAFNNEGPNVFVGSCKAPGEQDANQRFLPYAADARLLQSGLSGSKKVAGGADVCLTARRPDIGAALYTVDAAGQSWCAGFHDHFVTAQPCDPHTPIVDASLGWKLDQAGGHWTLTNGGQHLGIENSFGGSGPVPHSRWSTRSSGTKQGFLLDPAALASATGSPLRSTWDAIIDDDNTGGVKVGGTAFCVELGSGSSLETWAGQLSPDPASGASRWAVALFNRSPSADAIALEFSKLPGMHGSSSSSSAKAFVVRDVWANATHAPTSAAAYTAAVGGHDTALLVVTQVQAILSQPGTRSST